MSTGSLSKVEGLVEVFQRRVVFQTHHSARDSALVAVSVQ
jgi:hypothetical protein